MLRSQPSSQASLVTHVFKQCKHLSLHLDKVSFVDHIGSILPSVGIPFCGSSDQLVLRAEEGNSIVSEPCTHLCDHLDLSLVDF